MSKQKTVVLKALPGFQPGHARMGGRGKHSIAEARTLAAELGVSPMAYLLNLLAVDATEELEFTADGTERRVKVPVTRDQKITISQYLLNFFHPKLTSTQLTGKDDGPIEMGVIDINAMMADPRLVEACQTLSLAANSRAIDAGPARGLPHFTNNPLPE